MKREKIKQYLLIIFGAVLISAAFVLFITPYKIVPGGVYGAGVVLNHMFPALEVGTWGFMLDVPLMLTAFVLFGGHFGVKTVVAAVVIPIIMDSATMLIGSDPALMFGGAIDLSDDVLMACLFGGVILGAGVSLILKSRATSGGTDIVAMIVSRYAHMPIARALMIVDSTVVLFGLIALGDWKVPLYSIVTIFVCTKVVDYVLEGGSGDKLVFILSGKHDDMKHYILDDLSRGGTYIKSAGMYTNAPKEMIFVVISRRELTLLQDFVRKTDPDAFMIVVNAHETLGDGFKTFQEKVGG